MRDKRPTRQHSSSIAVGLPERFLELSGARKIDALLSVENPQELVRSFAADELYLLIHDIGLTDCTAVVAMTSLDQRQALIDLDCWLGDTFEVEDFHRWLDVIKDGSLDNLSETIGNVDPELLVNYILLHTTAIFDRGQEDDILAFQDYGALFYTPDREFALGMPPRGEESAPRLNFVLDQLYRFDPNLARNILRSAKGDLRIEAEESAYQFRTQRLCDLGFPPPDEAHILYAPIQIEALKASLDRSEKPHFITDQTPVGWALARSNNAGPFLDQCLEKLDDTDRFVREFTLCVNRAVVASPAGIALRNLDRVSSITRSVHATISLGLEHLAEGDPIHGHAILHKAWLVNLFQVGHAQTMLLTKRARHLEKRGQTLFDDKVRNLLTALACRPQPRFRMEAGSWIPFTSRADLAEADSILARGEQICDIFEQSFGFSMERFQTHEFSGIPEAQRPLISFDVLARTLVAHLICEGKPSFEPLSTQQLTTMFTKHDEWEAIVHAFLDRVDSHAHPIIEQAVLSLRNNVPNTRSVDEDDLKALSSVLLIAG